jgi:hypothetical protein
MSRLWRKIEATRRGFERKFTISFTRLLKKQIEPVIEYLSGNKQYYDISDIIDSLMNEDIIGNEIKTLYKKVGYKFIKLTPGLVKKADDDAERIFWEMELERIANEELGMKITSITGTNRDNLLRIVKRVSQEGIAEGKGIEQITRDILKSVKKDMPKYTRAQARTIAQTEVVQSSNKATWEAGKVLNIQVEKVWLIAPGGIVKNERHTLPGAIDKYQKPMNEKFMVDGGGGPVAMDHPGDPAGGAENVINCRCALAFNPV